MALRQEIDSELSFEDGWAGLASQFLCFSFRWKYLRKDFSLFFDFHVPLGVRG